MPISHTLLEVAEIAEAAAEAIMAVRAAGFEVTRKADASPVTEADMAAHRVIVERLQALTPEVMIISEENEQQPEQAPDVFWCVDPLDGTRSFARGEGEFVVSMARIEAGEPVLGVIACPLDGVVYAAARGQGAWRKRKGAAWERLEYSASGIRHSGKKPTAIIGSSYISQRMKHLLEAMGVREVKAMASARKFCVMAEGGADIYPRFAPTYEWDTAAGQVLVEEVGLVMTTMDGLPFRYGKPRFENGGFIVKRDVF